jgi:hypothetical protein
MMKRALTAALFSGLIVFAVPQAAFADHAPDHHADCAGKTEQSAGSDCAAQPEGAPAPDEHQAPDGSDRRENHDDDDGFILF